MLLFFIQIFNTVGNLVNVCFCNIQDCNKMHFFVWTKQCFCKSITSLPPVSLLTLQSILRYLFEYVYVTIIVQINYDYKKNYK